MQNERYIPILLKQKATPSLQPSLSLNDFLIYLICTLWSHYTLLRASQPERSFKFFVRKPTSTRQALLFSR